MHESKEKSTHKLPMPLPKTKQGDVSDMEECDAAKKQVEEELRDDTKANEALLGHQQMQMQFERLTVCQDELAQR